MQLSKILTKPSASSKNCGLILGDKNSFAFFVMEEGNYKGFCHCTCFNTFWLSGLTCYLSGIITDESVRGEGYGIALMDEVKRRAKELGCRGIILDSGLPRKEAHKFYEKYGFKEDGIRPDFYENPSEDAILMSAEILAGE